MRCLIASYDAGGAEVVSAWVKKNPDNEYSFLVAGPALSIFSRKIPELSVLKIDGVEWNSVDIAVTGTGWSSDLEREALEEAKRNGVMTVAVLDHWVNYRERFGYPGEDWLGNLPDEVWCLDEYAYDLCRELGFPAGRLRIKENEYYNEIRTEATGAYSGKRYAYLYLCEPVAEQMTKDHGDAMFLGYTEFTAMRSFFETLSSVVEAGTTVLVRKHPSEESYEKYAWIIDEYKMRFEIDYSESARLLDDIVSCDTIVGCESMAMVTAVILKKPVYTLLFGNSVCRLPFREIAPFRP